MSVSAAGVYGMGSVQEPAFDEPVTKSYVVCARVVVTKSDRPAREQRGGDDEVVVVKNNVLILKCVAAAHHSLTDEGENSGSNHSCANHHGGMEAEDVY